MLIPGEWRLVLLPLVLVTPVSAQRPSADEAGVLKGHYGPVLMGIFTPEGTQAITVSSDETVRLWDLKTRQEIRNYPGHSGPLFCLALARDGRTLATGSFDNTVRVWDVPLQKPIVRVRAHEGSAAGFAISQDGRLLVTGGADKIARLWNLSQLVKLTDPKLPVDPAKAGQRAGAAGEILLAAIRNDGNMIATGEADGRIRLYSPFVEEPEGEGFQHQGGITALAFHANNQQVISAGKDGFVRVWSLQAQPPKDILIGEKPLLDLALYNGGAQVITAGSDGRVLMTDTNSGQLVRAFAGLIGEAGAVASRLDNQRIAAGSSEGKVFLWNAGGGELLQTLQVPGAVVALAFSPDNQKLAVTTKDKALVIFGPPLPPQSPQPGNELAQHQQVLAESVLTRIVFDRENRSLWASDEAGHINQWAYASPVQVRQFNHGGAVYGVAVSGDGKTVVSCSTDQTVRIWDVPTGQQKAAMSGHQGAVHALALSPDESLVVSSGADKTVRLWDVAGGGQLKQLATFDETMYAVAIHPTGNTIAVGGADRKVHLINLLTGAIERTLEGHADYVHSVAFNPEGTRLLSYGYAGELKVWNPADGQILHQERIGRIGNFAHYASDGTRVLLSNGDGTARVYQLPAPAR